MLWSWTLRSVTVTHVCHCVQSGDNWRRIHGGEWSTDGLRTSCSRNVASCTGTSGIGQTSRDSALARRENATTHWTTHWFDDIKAAFTLRAVLRSKSLLHCSSCAVLRRTAQYCAQCECPLTSNMCIVPSFVSTGSSR